METTENLIDNLGEAIHKLRYNIIGYVKLSGNKNWSLILEYTKGRNNYVWIKTINITCSLGIHIENLYISKSTVKLFPDEKNMNDMLDNPFIFSNWCRENKII